METAYIPNNLRVQNVIDIVCFVFLTQNSFNSGYDTDAAANAADSLWDDNFKMITNEDSNIMQVSGARQRPEPDYSEKLTISDHNSSASV